MQIKNSGIYFVIIACIIILVSFFKGSKKVDWQRVVTMVAPFLSLYLWKTHCSYVFNGASVSKHAMTVDNYKQVYSSKTPDDIRLIIHRVFKYSVSGKDLFLVIAILAVMGVLTFIILENKYRKKYLKLLLLSVLLYVTWMIGVLLMYIYSMPGGEATSLAGLERYRQTIFVAIYYLISIVIVQCISEIEVKKYRQIYSIAMIIVLIMVWGFHHGTFANIFMSDITTVTFTEERRLWFENAIHENAVESGKAYAVCIPEDDAGYAYYLLKYLLYSRNISLRIVSENTQTEDLQNYDYVFVYDQENEIINNWINDNYPD